MDSIENHFDAYDEDEEEFLKPSSGASSTAVRNISILLFVFAIMILAIVWHYAHKYTVHIPTMEELPYIKAQDDIHRIKPADPGGVIFMNQDKEIYKYLAMKEDKAQNQTHNTISEDYTAQMIENSNKPEQD